MANTFDERPKKERDFSSSAFSAEEWLLERELRVLDKEKNSEYSKKSKTKI